MLGYITAITASILWSLTPVLISMYARDIDPITFNALRVLFSLPLLIVISIAIPREQFLILNPFSLALLLVASTLGPGLGDIAYIKAIQLIGSSRAVIIGYTYIFIAQTIASIALGEYIGSRLVIGSILAFSGIIVSVYTKSNSVNRKGIVYAVIASISWGIGSVVNRTMLVYSDPITLALLRMTILSILMVLVTYREIPIFMRIRRVFLCATATGVMAYSIGIPLFLYAMSVVGVAATVLATALTPILATILSRFLVEKTTSIRILIGAILAATGIAIAYTEKTM